MKITDSKKRTELFNSFIEKQYSIIDNGSEVSNELLLSNEKTSTKVEFASEDTSEIISSLEPNKSRGHDIIFEC